MEKKAVKENGHSFGVEKSAPLLNEVPKDHGINQPGLEYLRKELGKAIEELPLMEKVALSLYHYEKLTMPEIGEILGITQQKVHQIYSRAVLNLRSRVNDLIRIMPDLR